MEQLSVELYDVGAIKFGSFKLKSGVQSPVYFDLRILVSYPDLLTKVSRVLWTAVMDHANQFQSICGVPYTALPMATVISIEQNIPMLVRRKESKDYGTKKLIEGVIVAGSNCLVVEDVVTSGGSVLETCHALKTVGVGVAHAVVLLDREQGGRGNLQREGVKLTSVLSMTQLLEHLENSGKITMEMTSIVKQFLSENSSITVPKTVIAGNSAYLSYTERAQFSTNALTKRLLELMEQKSTNLALSADVGTSAELLEVAETLGPHICLLKTHIDLVRDFTAEVSGRLKELAQQHGFIIMEDRKFADIGNTVQLQYKQHLSSGWAELVTCHALPGPGVIGGLRSAAPDGCGCVIVAQMSTQGNLVTQEYTQAAVRMAEAQPDFVVGVVCRQRVSAHPTVVHMTPGIALKESCDSLGQQYVTPEVAVGLNHSDVIIVGRAILNASDRTATVKEFKNRAFSAYKQRLKQ